MKKFKWQKMLIPFVAILIIAAIAFKKPEGFQSTEKLAAVGIKFTGSLSTIYNVLTDTDIYNSDTIRNILINPVLILGPFLEKYPALRYSIIQVSTGNVIYDPIAQYEKNKTMDPFPKTTNSDTYIIYSNLFNIPISNEDVNSGLYPRKFDGTILTNCNIQSDRNYSEKLISQWKDVFSSIPILNGVKKYTKHYSKFATNFQKAIGDGTFDSEMLKRIPYSNKLGYTSVWMNILNELPSDQQKILLDEATAASGYIFSANQNDPPPTTEQYDITGQVVLKYIKTTQQYKDTLREANVTITVNSSKSVGDAFTMFFGLMPDLKWETTVYEPCMASGFQNMEGFAATNVNDLKLYDFKGNKLTTAPTAKDKGMDGLTIGLISLGVVLLIGGGVFLAIKSSNA